MANEEVLEVYKELGNHERHFNSIQGVYRGLASTWFLACFAAIGFVYTKDNKVEIPFDTELIASLTATVVSTGIFLFWILDVVVYHKLLLAVVNSVKNFESKYNTILPGLRAKMEESTEFFNVRKAISVYYFVPILILIITAIIFLIHCWSNILVFVKILQSIWLAILVLGGCVFLFSQHRDANK